MSTLANRPAAVARSVIGGASGCCAGTRTIAAPGGALPDTAPQGTSTSSAVPDGAILLAERPSVACSATSNKGGSRSAVGGVDAGSPVGGVDAGSAVGGVDAGSPVGGLG